MPQSAGAVQQPQVPPQQPAGGADQPKVPVKAQPSGGQVVISDPAPPPPPKRQVQIVGAWRAVVRSNGQQIDALLKEKEAEIMEI